MIISGISRQDLEAARDVAGTLLGNELIFSEFHSHGTHRHQVRLQVADLDLPGARRHSQLFRLGYGKRPRRSRFACAHSYAFLFCAIFERNPDARIQTAMATYRGFREFLETYPDVLDANIGSIMYPVRFGDECNCDSDYIPMDTITPALWERGRAELPSPDNTELIRAGGA
jgi:hypothetical protein